MKICLLIKDFAVGKKFLPDGRPTKSGAEIHGEKHPINPNAVALTSREICCPCTKKTCDEPRCLQNVTPAQVLDAAKKFLGEPK